MELKKENYALKRYAEVEQLPQNKARTQWFGIYRGVRFQIDRFKFREEDRDYKWTHYILLNIDEQLPPEFVEKFWLAPQYTDNFDKSRKRLHYDYYDSIISNLEFHGGCTWYSKEGGADEPHRVVKIGCDYQHLWDEGQRYDLDDVYRETKRTIDSLWMLVGKVKVRSFGDGKYRYLEEFEDTAAQQADGEKE